MQFSGLTGSEFTIDVLPMKGQGRTNIYLWTTLAGYTYRSTIAVSLECVRGDAVLQSTGQCVPCDNIPAEQLNQLTPGDRLVFERNCISRFERNGGTSLCDVSQAHAIHSTVGLRSAHLRPIRCFQAFKSR